MHTWGASSTYSVWASVIGLVPDLKTAGIANPDHKSGGIYFPFTQYGPYPDSVWNFGYLQLVVRTTVDPFKAVPVIRKTLALVDPDVASYWMRTLNDIIREERAPYDLSAILFTVFGVVALLLSLVGLFGVMYTSVNQRIREIGVRMALGGQRAHILGLILRQGATQVGIGIVLGLILALFSARFLSAMIFHVSPYDVPIYLLVLGTIAAAGLLACLVPAWKAANIYPNEALRVD